MMKPKSIRCSLPLSVALLSLAGCNSGNTNTYQGTATQRTMISAPVRCLNSEDPSRYVSADACKTEGTIAIDAYNTLYRIEAMYADGRADATWKEYPDQGMTVLIPGSFFPEVQSIQGYNVYESSFVIDAYDRRYRVMRLFSNGMIRVEEEDSDGAKSFMDIRDIAVEVPRIQRFESGTHLMDQSNRRFRVIRAYSDGRLLVEDVDGEHSKRVLKASEASAAIR